MKKCTKCKQWKDESEFYKDHVTKDGSAPWCKECKSEYNRSYYKNHHVKKMSENKKCPVYLGIYINERILKHVMPNAVLMNYANPGFDLVCGKGYLVDAKSSVLHHRKNQGPYWMFGINKNKTPDYFLLTAYTDRESLNIDHMWLIPGDVINDKTIVGLSLSTIHKWDDYKIDHTAALNCVNQIKASA